MDHWTVEDVSHWLKTNGLEQFVTTFIDEDIDGIALMGLFDDEILKLLSTVNEDGTRNPPTLRTQRKFRKLLEEYQSEAKHKRKKRPHSFAVLTTDDFSTKIYTIASTSDSLKFFRSEFITSSLTKYFLEKYKVNCEIPVQLQWDTMSSLDINLSGMSENIRTVQKDLQLIFGKIEMKIFDDEAIHKRMIRWSKSLYSHSVQLVLVRIFAKKNMLTVWEKTSLLSRYFRVYYLTGEHPFSTSEESIMSVVEQEISYVRDLIVPNLETMSKKFRDELNDLIKGMKEQQQRLQVMAILIYQTSPQTDMRISFFGLKNQVYLAKKQIKMLIHKHQTRTVQTGLDSAQRNYLLEHHTHRIRMIELNSPKDHVKIDIHADAIHAPQYLIVKIKELIQSMTNQRRVLCFSYIPNAFVFTENDRAQLEIITQHYNCQIEQIQSETRKELIVLPKGKNNSTSNYLNKESNQFQSSFPISKSLPVLNHSIEIHQSYDLPIDLMIISTVTDANREQIDPEFGNCYYESEAKKKILFIQWSYSPVKASIKRFISASFKQIDTQCSDTIKTIAFSTTDWEKSDQRKELIEGILHEIQVQLQSKEYANRSWRILLILNEEQKDFFNEFLQIMANENSDEQFFHPVSTISITLKAPGNTTISKCEQAIENYMKKHVLITTKLNNPFDSNIWNQAMIHAFYKYCLEKFVLPRVGRTLELIGSNSGVNEAQQKYELMFQIEREKSSTSPLNIVMSCSSADRILSNQLAQRLLDEGHAVSTNYSSDSQPSKFNKADVVIICFSQNYSEDVHCMKTTKWIIESSKKFIPVLFTRSSINGEENWLQRIAIEERFYFSFKQGIRFRLKEDLNLDYDRLILEVYRCMKPSPVNQTDIPVEENLEQQQIVPRFTPEEIEEKKQIYEQQIRQVVEVNQIDANELADIISALNNVLADECTVVETDYFNGFLSAIKRWLEKANNQPMIKGNLPPFTPTGDYNDAVFPIPWADKEAWWILHSKNLRDFDHSLSDVFTTSHNQRMGSWPNYDDTHRYYQKFLVREIQFRQKERLAAQQKQKKRSVAQHKTDSSGTNEKTSPRTSRHPHFKTTIRKSTTAWDITINHEVLREYERQSRKGEPLNDTENSPGWIRWLNQSVKLISDIKKGKISMDSDEVKGRIGRAEKTDKEKRKRERLDDPNYKRWKMPSFRQQHNGIEIEIQNFIQMKIQNTLQWKEFCLKQ